MQDLLHSTAVNNCFSKTNIQKILNIFNRCLVYTFIQFYDKLIEHKYLLKGSERPLKGEMFMITTKNLPPSERPYEKCEKYGPEHLSNAELLAIIIKTGTKQKRSVELAHEILSLAESRGGLYGLYELSTKELLNIEGIGRVKALQILCTLELAKRLSLTIRPNRVQLDNPSIIADLYMNHMCHYRQEHLILLMLDTKNRMIKDLLLSKGCVNASLISTREIFCEALRYDAVNIILVHNHPSGDPTPSEDDISVTKEIQTAGKIIGIQLLDHIIIGNHTFKSLHTCGYM